MSRRFGTVARTAAMASVSLVLAVGVGACGDDDEGGDANASQQDAKTTTTAAQPTTPEGKVRALYASNIDATYAKDGKTVCDTLSASARKSLQQQAGSCEAWFKSTLGGNELSKNRPFIVKLNMQGNRARALVKTKNSNRYPVYFVKQDGEWKIALDSK
jgi:hypothetical protein